MTVYKRSIFFLQAVKGSTKGSKILVKKVKNMCIEFFEYTLASKI